MNKLTLSALVLVTVCVVSKAQFIGGRHIGGGAGILADGRSAHGAGINAGRRRGIKDDTNLRALNRRQGRLGARGVNRARGSRRAQANRGDRLGHRSNLGAAQFNNFQRRDNVGINYNKAHSNSLKLALESNNAHQENLNFHKNSGVNHNSGAKLAANNAKLAESVRNVNAADDFDGLSQNELAFGTLSDDQFNFGRSFNGLDGNFLNANNGYFGRSNFGQSNFGFFRK